MGNGGDVLGFFGAPIEKDAGPSDPSPVEPDGVQGSELTAGPLPEVEKERSNFEEAIKRNPRLRPFVENALYHLQAAHQAAAESLALAGEDTLSEEDRTKRARILEGQRRENFGRYAETLKDLGLFPSVSVQPPQWNDGPSFVEIHRKYIGEVRARAANKQSEVRKVEGDHSHDG